MKPEMFMKFQMLGVTCLISKLISEILSEILPTTQI